MTFNQYLSPDEDPSNCEYFRNGSCNAIDLVCYRKANNLTISGCKTRDVHLKSLNIILDRILNG